MITSLLGKILFPRCQSWQRVREAKTILAAALVALALAAAIGLVIYSRNSLGQ